MATQPFRPGRKCPPIHPELLEYLRFLYPDRTPRTETSPYMLGVLGGRQDVIEVLQARFTEQQNQP